MDKLYKDIDSYYTKKIQQHGPTPQGVDWNSIDSQLLRFEQLSKVISTKNNFSISDIGCGYGGYYGFILEKYEHFEYTGYDLSAQMINTAKSIHKDKLATFHHIDNLNNIQTSDYSIASGIFNVKMDFSYDQWLKYILETLDIMNKKSTLGFSFNMLTKYSDTEYMKDNLYYGDPCFFFDYCKVNFSKNISLNHDYELYEFTIIVRKD